MKGFGELKAEISRALSLVAQASTKRLHRFGSSSRPKKRRKVEEEAKRKVEEALRAGGARWGKGA